MNPAIEDDAADVDSLHESVAIYNILAGAKWCGDALPRMRPDLFHSPISRCIAELWIPRAERGDSATPQNIHDLAEIVAAKLNTSFHVVSAAIREKCQRAAYRPDIQPGEAVDWMEAAGRRRRLREASDAVAREWSPERERRLRDAIDAGTERRRMAPLDPGESFDPADWTETRIVTGWRLFDDALGGGLEPGTIVGIVAPPKAGKSALAMQVALCTVRNSVDTRVLWCRGEMSDRRLWERALQHISGQPPAILRMQTEDLYSPDVRRKKLDAIEELVSVRDRMLILPTPLSVAAIDAAIVGSKASVVVVDYLQRMEARREHESRVAELEEIGADLADMAQRRQVAVLLLSAMSNAQAGAEAVSVQAAFKGCGQIANDVDVIFCAKTEPEQALTGPRVITWACIANRSGEPRSLKTMFNGSTQTFTEQESQTL